jgi:hypothetical protein
MNCTDVERSGCDLILSLTIDTANRGKPQARQEMDGSRPEQDLYQIKGRRNTDTATGLLISTVTLTTQVQRPLIIVRQRTSETTPL